MTSSDHTPTESDFALARPGNNDAGLAPLLLTVTELIRQLMEAQIIRRMESGRLAEEDLDRAAASLRRLETEIVHLCEVFEVDQADLSQH